jgi:hypothetical protein
MENLLNKAKSALNNIILPKIIEDSKKLKIKILYLDFHRTSFFILLKSQNLNIEGLEVLVNQNDNDNEIYYNIQIERYSSIKIEPFNDNVSFILNGEIIASLKLSKFNFKSIDCDGSEMLYILQTFYEKSYEINRLLKEYKEIFRKVDKIKLDLPKKIIIEKNGGNTRL